MSATTSIARDAAAKALGRLLWLNGAGAVGFAAVSIPALTTFGQFGIDPPLLPGPAVALVVSLIGGPGAWVGIFLGALATGMAMSVPLPISLGDAAVTTLAAGLAARWLRMPLQGRAPTLLFREVLRLLGIGAVVHGALAALGHVAVLALAGANIDSPLLVFGATLSNTASGTMVLAPILLLAWIDRRSWSRDRQPERFAIFGVVVGLTLVRLFVPGGEVLHPGLPFLFLLPCTWLSVRYAQREAAILFGGCMLLAMIGAAIMFPTDSVVAYPFMGGIGLAVGVLNTLLVSSLAEERRVALMLAGVDALSGVANRRTFFDRASQEAERAKRYRRPLAIASFDLDSFKQVNDTFGHAAGDAAIRATATAVAGQLRRLDTLARIGGDEFAVLMPETDPTSAEQVSERLRRAVAATVIAAGEATFSVRATFGVTEFDSERDTIESALARADKALYRGKEEGRDRVVAF